VIRKHIACRPSPHSVPTLHLHHYTDNIGIMNAKLQFSEARLPRLEAICSKAKRRAFYHSRYFAASQYVVQNNTYELVFITLFLLPFDARICGKLASLLNIHHIPHNEKQNRQSGRDSEESLPRFLHLSANPAIHLFSP
jgi:hypothetical protein